MNAATDSKTFELATQPVRSCADPLCMACTAGTCQAESASAPPAPAMATWTWNQTADGYEATDGRARLVRRGTKGKSWVLVTRDGTEHPLPRRASFDHAERLLAQLGVR